jgi:hypothetical protein
MPVSDLAYIGYAHAEADECGAMNAFLEVVRGWGHNAFMLRERGGLGGVEQRFGRVGKSEGGRLRALSTASDCLLMLLMILQEWQVSLVELLVPVLKMRRRAGAKVGSFMMMLASLKKRFLHLHCDWLGP